MSMACSCTAIFYCSAHCAACLLQADPFGCAAVCSTAHILSSWDASWLHSEAICADCIGFKSLESQVMLEWCPASERRFGREQQRDRQQ